MNRSFIGSIMQVKALQRTGWVQSMVEEPESVADHCYSMALMAAVKAKEKDMNMERAVMMALIHDLAEGIVGDITPKMGMSRDRKRLHERRALAGIVADLPEDIRDLCMELYDEFEDLSTPEARLVSDLDILDRVVTAKTYMRGQRDLDLSAFFDEAELDFIEDEELRRFAEDY